MVSYQEQIQGIAKRQQENEPAIGLNRTGTHQASLRIGFSAAYQRLHETACEFVCGKPRFVEEEPHCIPGVPNLRDRQMELTA
jgi:hypothetical protein